MALALSAYFHLVRHERGSSGDRRLVDYLEAAHAQLAQFGACRHEGGTFLRLAIPHLLQMLSHDEEKEGSAEAEDQRSEGRRKQGELKQKKNKNKKKPEENRNESREESSESLEDEIEDIEEEDDFIEDIEEKAEGQLLQCLYCLYDVQLCDARKRVLDRHPGRGHSFSPQTPAQAAALLRAIRPFIRRPARLPAPLKASAFDALQQVLHHFPLPPASLCMRHPISPQPCPGASTATIRADDVLTRTRLRLFFTLNDRQEWKAAGARAVERAIGSVTGGRNAAARKWACCRCGGGEWRFPRGL
jgi:hypothetical protein